MLSIRKRISPTFCRASPTIRFIASKSSFPGTLPFAKSVEPQNPTNTISLVSTMPPSWTRLARLCQYGLALTLTEEISCASPLTPVSLPRILSHVPFVAERSISSWTAGALPRTSHRSHQTTLRKRKVLGGLVVSHQGKEEAGRNVIAYRTDKKARPWKDS